MLVELRLGLVACGLRLNLSGEASPHRLLELGLRGVARPHRLLERGLGLEPGRLRLERGLVTSWLRMDALGLIAAIASLLREL